MRLYVCISSTILSKSFAKFLSSGTALGSEVTVPILGFPVDPLPWGVVTLTIMDPEGVDWDVGIPLEAGVVAVVGRRGWTNIRYEGLS